MIELSYYDFIGADGNSYRQWQDQDGRYLPITHTHGATDQQVADYYNAIRNLYRGNDDTARK